MDVILRRISYRSDGIFGELYSKDLSFLSYTLEHSYCLNFSEYSPKIPVGVYECIKGIHRLPIMRSAFETYEIMNVPNHKDILFHRGNFNMDSAGCVLLGAIINRSNERQWFLEHSKTSFESFMNLQKGIDKFQIEIIK